MDYDEMIDDKYMELVEGFVEVHKRQPLYEESTRLYGEARSLVEDYLCSEADAMRKREKGE